MDNSFFIKKRANPRVNVLLKADFQIHGRGEPYQDCLITNISVSGAGVTFTHKNSESITTGTMIVFKIHIPKTVLHVSVKGEVVWAKQRTKDSIAGIRFHDMLSESMFLQLQKKNDRL